MKKIFNLALTVALLALAVGCVASCGANDTFSQKEKEGYDVTVKFDPNGGMFAETANTVLYDAFDIDSAKTDSNGKKVIKLVAPDDEEIRGNNAKTITHAGTKYDGGTVKYTFGGWYTERVARVDESGNPLDDYGVPTSESGRPQGYTYSGRWNFDEQRLRLDADGEYDIRESVLTLYAAWIPYTTFEIYDGEGELYHSVYSTSIKIPTWNEKTGEVSYGEIKKLSGKTFDSAYFLDDVDMENSLSGEIKGEINYSNGTLESEVIKIRTTWLDGEWYKIFNANQFRNKFKQNGNYILGADIDFSGYDDPFNYYASSAANKVTEFSGTIDGNGFVIKGIDVKQRSDSRTSYGIFPFITKDARLIDLAFEDISFTVTGGPARGNTAYSFGLLFSGVEDGAVIENLVVSGKLKLDFSPSRQIVDNTQLYKISSDGWMPSDGTVSVECELNSALGGAYEAEVYDDGEIYLVEK